MEPHPTFVTLVYEKNVIKSVGRCCLDVVHGSTTDINSTKWDISDNKR